MFVRNEILNSSVCTINFNENYISILSEFVLWVDTYDWPASLLLEMCTNTNE